MLVSAGLNDPRVTYWEPAKWVARLRSVRTNDAALLLRTNMGAGHAGKSGHWGALREDAEEYAFVLTQLGVEETRRRTPAHPHKKARAPPARWTRPETRRVGEESG